MRVTQTCGRLVRLGGIVARTAWRIAFLRQDPAFVVHEESQRILGLVDLDLRLVGAPPPSGLIVANHLSYLDILLLASSAPTVFVAKSEVAGWPVFGWFARRLGCIFVERARPASSAAAACAIREALSAGRRLVLFPEATSGDGSIVLPFRSALLQPAVGRPLTLAAIRYALEPGDGDPAEFVCFWGDMALVPHLVRLFSRKRVRVSLSFESVCASSLDRKALAVELRKRTSALMHRPANGHLRGPRGAISRHVPDHPVPASSSL